MNNEEKIFNLLEKVYIELQDTKKELKAEVQENRVGIERLGVEVQKNREGIERLRSGMDELQMQLNTLTAKTAHNENKIIELSRDLKRVK